ncbi:MAG: DNA-protecting protein DprA [Treponema sp.]|nr:DNA-protecting protein DprA [Treponema sp.]MBR6914391.1 DNA-protecting protein DprA [Treponema sp.]
MLQTDADFNLLKKISVSNIHFLSLNEKINFERYLDSVADRGGYDALFEKIRTISKDEIFEIAGRKSTRAVWDGDENLKKARLAKKIIDSFGIKAVFYGESNFPTMLSKSTEVTDPPYSLFYRGNLDVLKRHCVSVVGTRRATFDALKAASDFSKSACDDGACVISGLAFGIDIESHKGAMSSSNPATVAVLPGGIDVIVPKSHAKYAAKILSTGGLLMSEYIPGTPAEKFRFVQRNRIVAALSPATVVIQAPAGSGSMITAGLALGYNREVFFHSANFSGQSAKLCEAVANQLLNDVRCGLKTKESVACKIDNSPLSFVSSGAKVISSYAEYKSNLYGENSEKIVKN